MARRSIRVGLVGAILVAGAAVHHDVGAAETAPGAPALKRAREQWDRSALEKAEPLYREALEQGGLAPPEVLEGYVRLGSIRAALGKKESAVAAFRAASILDAGFSVPSEAGARGAHLAEKAKRDTAKIGSIQLALQVPKETAAGKSFKVTATLDKAHMPIVNKLAVIAKDGTTGKEVSVDAKPDESVDFDISSDVTLPGASIAIRLDALDGHQNRLATVEERVRIPDKEPVAAAPRPSPKESPAPLAYKPPGGDPDVRRGGSFWSSPWPYIIGGLALAGAGTAIYFGTRPIENVSVGEVNVR